MAVIRLVGSAWASTHGPADPGAMLRWALRSEFGGILVGPCTRPIDWQALAAAAADLPVSFPAAHVGGVLLAPRDRLDAGLASGHEGERQAAVRAVEETVRIAGLVGARTVVLEPGLVAVPGEPGVTDLADTDHRWTRAVAEAWMARRRVVRDAALDRLCRVVFELGRRHPDTTFALTASRDVLGLGEPHALAAIFEDLGGRLRLGYWHDAGVAALRQERLGTEQGEWLNAFAERLAGISAGDHCDGRPYSLPGSGSVDYPLLAAYRSRHGPPLPVALDLEPQADPTEIQGAHAFLSKFGL